MILCRILLSSSGPCMKSITGLSRSGSFGSCRRTCFIDCGSSPVWNNAPEALESLAKQLAALPCLLFHDDQTCTPAANDGKGGICFISTYMKVAFRILESDDARRIHQSVRAAVYDALAKSLRHQTAPLGERLLEDLMTFIGRGMKAIYRPIRMAAGYDI